MLGGWMFGYRWRKSRWEKHACLPTWEIRTSTTYTIGVHDKISPSWKFPGHAGWCCAKKVGIVQNTSKKVIPTISSRAGFCPSTEQFQTYHLSEICHISPHWRNPERCWISFMQQWLLDFDISAPGYRNNPKKPNSELMWARLIRASPPWDVWSSWKSLILGAPALRDSDMLPMFTTLLSKKKLPRSL